MAYITPPTGGACKWRNASATPPPAAGWYPCSIYKVPHVLRYFDGVNWSNAISADRTKRDVERKLQVGWTIAKGLHWTDPWW